MIEFPSLLAGEQEVFCCCFFFLLGRCLVFVFVLFIGGLFRIFLPGLWTLSDFIYRHICILFFRLISCLRGICLIMFTKYIAYYIILQLLRLFVSFMWSLTFVLRNAKFQCYKDLCSDSFVTMIVLTTVKICVENKYL